MKVMSKLFELYDIIDALDLPESKKYNMRLLASQIETGGFSRGFTAGIKEGRELEAMKHLPHNKPINNETVANRAKDWWIENGILNS
jgi:hypothetical protein